jgi:hypothetical protein
MKSSANETLGQIHMQINPTNQTTIIEFSIWVNLADFIANPLNQTGPKDVHEGGVVPFNR